MKKHGSLLRLVCLLVCLAALFGLAFRGAQPQSRPVAADTAPLFGQLLTDLVKAYETPTAWDADTIRADLQAIRDASPEDYALAKSVADHWSRVYLDPDYRMYLWGGGETAEELAGVGIPDGAAHAIVVLGYELRDGDMQPELKGRCEAAAAAARSFPSAILVCSGGATGSNNPDRHTEAGLMKAYLTEVCGIDEARIHIDENAMTTGENAVNTLRILQENGIHTMTIVTSSYHQRWGQAVYNAVAEIYRQQVGYPVEIVGNYSYDIEPSVDVYRQGDRIAVRQIAGILGLPGDVIRALPDYRSAA